MIDELLNALHDYQMAKSEHDSARDGYQGYSWGWAGQHLIDEMKKAREQAELKLNEIIDARIKAHLQEQRDGLL